MGIKIIREEIEKMFKSKKGQILKFKRELTFLLPYVDLGRQQSSGSFLTFPSGTKAKVDQIKEHSGLLGEQDYLVKLVSVNGEKELAKHSIPEVAEYQKSDNKWINITYFYEYFDNIKLEEVCDDPPGRHGRYEIAKRYADAIKKGKPLTH